MPPLLPQDPDPNFDAVLGFFNIPAFVAAMAENAFDEKQYFYRLLALCDNADPKVQLAALKEFRSVRDDILAKNNLLQQAKVTEVRTAENGDQVRITASQQRLKNALTKGNTDGPAPQTPHSYRPALTPSVQHGNGGLTSSSNPSPGEGSHQQSPVRGSSADKSSVRPCNYAGDAARSGDAPYRHKDAAPGNPTNPEEAPADDPPERHRGESNP